MMRIHGRAGSGKKGAMPMALIAVALLVAGAFYGIVYANIERGTENADSANAEFGTVDDAIERARTTIEAELGRIITDISADDCGTLVDRSKRFSELSDGMFEQRFPNTCKGVVTELEDRSIRLSLENMNLGGEVIGGDSCASFLSAKGTVTLTFTSESTVSRKTIQVNADATSALPLIAETSTRFELAVGGSGSVLSQMIDYQLNAVASQRIMSSYGMFARGGDFGTSGIITEKDVYQALKNALSVIEKMYFRNTSDGRLTNCAFVDLADLIVLDGGCLVLDVGALLSQAIVQRVDEYALQWLEYLGLDRIVEWIDVIVDTVRNIVDFARKLFNKDATRNDTIDYIRKQMSNLGYDQDDYRYFAVPSKTFSLPEYTYFDPVDNKFVHLDASEFTMDELRSDLFDWDGWEDYLKDYHNSNNEFLQSIRETLMTVAVEACTGCTVRIPLNAFDSRNYLDDLRSSVSAAVNGSLNRFIDNSARTIRDCRISDPIMCEIYHTVCDNRYEIFGLDNFREKREDTANHIDFVLITSEARAELSRLIELMSDDGELMDYCRQCIDERVGFLGILTDSKKSDRISKELASTVGHFLRDAGIEDAVRLIALRIVEETVQHISVNPYSRALELPSSPDFMMRDKDGNAYSERMTVRSTDSVQISVTDPVHNGGRNMHYIGMIGDRTARYSSVFTVRISGTIGYTVSTTNPIYEKLGLSDSVYSGTIPVDIRTDVSCMSAYPLSGVTYQKSNTLYSDCQEYVMMFINRLIETLYGPMDVMMQGLENLMDITSTAMIEYGNFMNEIMERFYSAIAVPMEYLQDIANQLIQQITSEFGLENVVLMLGSQTFVFDLFGAKVTVETNLRSLEKATKEFVKVTVEKALSDTVSLKATLAYKENSRVGQYILASGGMTGEDWEFQISFDPMMSAGTHLASISGHVRDVDFSGNFPELVQYQILSLSTDDIPGVREALNNIPLPLIGYKCDVEIGVYAKYDLPVETGLLINEVELNPEGNDTGREWVELYNNSECAVDLLGYTLTPSSGGKNAVSIGDIVLGPRERTVIYFPNQSLNNEGGPGNKSGIRIMLYDTYGNLVDRTPAMKDKDNNGSTWQRTEDASVNWSFMPGTEDSRNNGGFPGSYMLKTALIEFAKDAAVEVLDEMGDRIEGSDQCIEYAERVMARIIDKFIDSVSKCLVEACAFVRFELTDYSQSQHYGMKVMLGVDSNLVADVLRYIASMIPTIGGYIACPQGLTAEEILYDDVFLKIMTYTGISAPKFLKVMMEDTEVDAAISVKFNISAVSTLWGEQKGRWSAEAGIVLENVPTEMVPDCFQPESYMKSDLWLFRMVFTERETA